MNNRVKEAFHNIHADDPIKINTTEFLYHKTNQYKKTRFFSYQPFVAAAVCSLFVLFGWKGYSIYFTSVSTISIDINPSIELDINQFDKVIDIKSYNDDGDFVVSSINIRFLDYRKALNLLLQNRNMASYLTQEQTIIITVFGTSDKKNNEMLTGLTSCTASYENVHCSSGNSAEVKEAHSLGLSYGKYKAFLELQALDPGITAEDIQGLTMRQIRDMITELSNSVNDAPQEKNTTGNRGRRHGNSNRYRNRNCR